MTQRLTTIGDADRQAIGQALEHDRQRLVNTSGRSAAPDGSDEHVPGHVFVAKTPAGGIPALKDDKVPGHATCEIYRVEQTSVPADSGAEEGSIEASDHFDYEITRLVGVSQEVFNLAEEILQPNIWIVVARDVLGFWWPTNVGSGANVFWGVATNRTMTTAALGSRWVYGLQEQIQVADGTWDTLEGGRTGDAGGGVEIEITQTADASVPRPQITRIVFTNATGGTAKIGVDGTPTGDIAYNASDPTIQAALTATGATFGASPGPGLFLSGEDPPVAHAFTFDENKLEPKARNPMFEKNNKKVEPGTGFLVKPGWKDSPPLIEVIAGETVPEYEFTVKASSGSYKITLKNTTGGFQAITAALVFNANLAAIQAAIDLVAPTTLVDWLVSNWAINDDGTITFKVQCIDSVTSEVTGASVDLKPRTNYGFEYTPAGSGGGGGSDPCGILNPTSLAGYDVTKKLALVMEIGATCPSWKEIKPCP